MARQSPRKHKHANSLISGVMYLGESRDESLPPVCCPRTRAMFPREFRFGELNGFNASWRTFQPADGMLMLFPSLPAHEVEQNRSGRERIRLAFNTYVRGKVGGAEQLTEGDR